MHQLEHLVENLALHTADSKFIDALKRRRSYLKVRIFHPFEESSGQGRGWLCNYAMSLSRAEPIAHGQPYTLQRIHI